MSVVNHLIQEPEPSDPIIVFTDASAVGGGGYIANMDATTCSFWWSTQEAATSSTHRELLAFLKTLKLLKVFLQKRNVIWKSDSANAVDIAIRGSIYENRLTVSFCQVA